ncbi:hypothetical protein [Moraxella lacunata]|uniref:hypothetical protein n=1 Tax=Moraxella lacunata TaxID=477 RepID=UPI003EE03DF2
MSHQKIPTSINTKPHDKRFLANKNHPKRIWGGLNHSSRLLHGKCLQGFWR